MLVLCLGGMCISPPFLVLKVGVIEVLFVLSFCCGIDNCVVNWILKNKGGNNTAINLKFFLQDFETLGRTFARLNTPDV